MSHYLSQTNQSDIPPPFTDKHKPLAQSDQHKNHTSLHVPNTFFLTPQHVKESLAVQHAAH